MSKIAHTLLPSFFLTTATPELPMKRFLVLVAFLGLATVTACGQPQLIIEAAISDDSGERLALSELPIRLLPYDRDAIFDSLEAAYPTPEPTIPADVIEAQQQVQEAQAEWRAAETRWATVRDSLRIISEQLEQMQNQGLRASQEYRQRFERFNVLDGQLAALEREQTEAFQRFTSLQEATLARADSIRIQRELWAEEAFADFNQVVLQKLRESGREEIADTTNAQGFAAVAVPEGQWWIYARYTLPYEELYWNLPTQVSGDSTYVTLSRENAEVRPVL